MSVQTGDGLLDRKTHTDLNMRSYCRDIEVGKNPGRIHLILAN